MKKRVIVLILMFIFAWTFPLTHNVEVKVNIGKALPKQVVQTKATPKQKYQNKVMAMRYAKAGWGWDRTQRRCAYALFMKESRFDHLADNPRSTAFGIGQVLKEKSKHPDIQILNAYKYIKHRYDTPCRALNHHNRKNWY
jgi:hypothetical protein